MAGKPKRKADLALMTERLADIELMLSEGKSHAEVYRALNVSKMSWYDWVGSPEGRDLLARARTRATDRMAEEVLQIADTAAPEEAQVAKLRIDTRKWLASKWNRSIYGDDRAPLVNISIDGLHMDSLRKADVAQVIDAIDKSSD